MLWAKGCFCGPNPREGLILVFMRPTLYRSICLVLLPFVAGYHLNAQPYKNLVLEGGGIRGIAYTGAFEVLEQHHMLDSVRNIAGTSVGAVAGSLLSAGYKAQEIKELMSGLRVQTFNDGQWFFVGGQQRMRQQYGWYR